MFINLKPILKTKYMNVHKKVNEDIILNSLDLDCKEEGLYLPNK